MADSIGVLFVKVEAETKGLKKQIEKDLSKLGKGVGNDFAKNFDEAVQKDIKQHDYFKTLEDQARAHFANMGDDFKKALAENKPLPIRFDTTEIGRSIGVIKRKFKDLDVDVEKDLVAAYRKAFDEQEKLARVALGAEEKDRLASERKIQEAHLRALAQNVQFDKRALAAKMKAEASALAQKEKLITALFRKEMRNISVLSQEELKSTIRRLAKEEDLTLESAVRIAKEIERRNIKAKVKIDIDEDWLSKIDLAIRKFLNKNGKIKIKMEVDNNLVRRFLADTDRGLGKLIRKLKNMSRGGGFFNILTEGLAGLVGMVKLGIDLVGGFAAALVSLGKSLKSAVVSSGNMTEAITGIVAALAEFAATGVGLAVIVGVIVAATSAIGLLAAAVSMLVGLLVVLASNLILAASSAAVLAPALGAVATGMVAIAIGSKRTVSAIGAFAKAMNETDPKARAADLKAYNKQLAALGPNARAAARAFEPLVSQFLDIRDRVEENLFAGLADDIGKLGPVLKVVGDGLEGLATAANHAIGYFITLVTQKKNLESLKRVFDGFSFAFERFGDAVGNIFIAILNIFDALTPTLEKFSTALADITKKFADWTGSVEGKNALKDFFDQAYEAGANLIGTLRNIGEALGIIFGAATKQKPGQEPLQGLLDASKSFLDMIKEAATIKPGQKKSDLDQWIQDAKDFGKALWDAAGALKDIFTALNTPENRRGLLVLIGIVGNLAHALGNVFHAVGNVSHAFGNISHAFGNVLRFLGDIPRKFTENFAMGMQNVGTAAVNGFMNGLSSLWTRIQDAFRIAVDLVKNLLGISSPSTVFMNMALDVVTGFINGLLSLPGRVVQMFRNMYNSVLTFLGIRSPSTVFMSIAWDVVSGFISGLLSLPGRVVRVFQDMYNAVLRYLGIRSPSTVFMDIAQSVVSGFMSGLASLPSKVANVFKGISENVGLWVEDIKGKIAGINLPTGVNIGDLWKGLFGAAGGVVSSPRQVLVGEAGPEAIIPLTRPLHLVDPSVRDMAALIRGERQSRRQSVVPGVSKVFNNEIKVYTTGVDPRAVAEQVVNRAAAMAS